jgi:hypothetical protein
MPDQTATRPEARPRHATATPRWLTEYFTATPSSPGRPPLEWRRSKVAALERQFSSLDVSLQRLATAPLTLAEQDAIFCMRDELAEVRDRILRRMFDA